MTHFYYALPFVNSLIFVGARHQIVVQVKNIQPVICFPLLLVRRAVQNPVFLMTYLGTPVWVANNLPRNWHLMIILQIVHMLNVIRNPVQSVKYQLRKMVDVTTLHAELVVTSFAGYVSANLKRFLGMVIMNTGPLVNITHDLMPEIMTMMILICCKVAKWVHTRSGRFPAQRGRVRAHHAKILCIF